jgi:hypothetical protein
LMIGLPGHKRYSVNDAMKLTSTETGLTGKWKIVKGRIWPDSTCQRIA